MDWPSGIVSFLFTDIEGSSTKWDVARGAMESAVALHDEILTRAVSSNGGRLVKKLGDGVLAAFADPANAVAAAVAGQQAVEAADWGDSVAPLKVRMGIHTGPGTPVDGDYLGPALNRAARIEAAGHGGQILVSAATRELIADAADRFHYRDLGQHHLRGLARPERIFQVDIDGAAGDFPPLRTESTPSNLPAAVKSFVGRAAELEQLSSLIDDSRLVTVIGPGGAGKTSLAIEAARRRTDLHPAGVWLVELASIPDGELIPTEILGSLSLPAPAGSDSLAALSAALIPEQALLVIDNCEHLLSDAAAVISAILRSAPRIKVVATSREALNVAGERAWLIPTLALPAADDQDAVAASDAGSLFVDRAESTASGFALEEGNAGTIADICRRLDGLPLAIELAAARTRSMSVSEIDQRLEDRFKLLRGGARDDVPHHRTLRESVAWSHDLLSPQQQNLFRCLSIFAGGFDLDAAETLVGDSVDVIDGLDDLVSQSLLIADRGDRTRYQMLETIRQYGQEQLAGADEAAAVQQAHFDWVAALVREGGRELEGRNQVMWLKKFRLEIDNTRVALGWARDHDPVAGATVVSALTRFFWMHAAEGDSTAMRDSTSFLNEGYRWATSMLETAGDRLPDKLRARLQLGTGGLLCIRTGRFEDALERLAEAAAIFEAERDTRSLGWATFYRGCAGVGLVPFEETLATFERSTALHTKAEDKFGVVMGSLLVGLNQLTRDHDVVREKVDWIVATAQQIGVPTLLAHAADFAAQADANLGTVSDESKRRSAQALATFRKIHNYACVCHTLFGAACVLAEDGDVEAAARAWGVTEAIQERLSMVIAPYEKRERLMDDIVGESFQDDAWNAACAEGATFEPDEGIDWVIGNLGFDAAELVE